MKNKLLKYLRAWIGYNKKDTIALLLAYNGCLFFTLFGFPIIDFLTKLMESI